MRVSRKNIGSQISSIKKPEDLERIVRRRDDKALYFALKNVDFSYGTLFKYLVKEFYSAQVDVMKSRSAQLSELMEVSEATFYRWKNSRKKVEEKYAERLSELIILYSYGEEVFDSKKSFLEWLNSPNIHFNMNPPIDHLDSLPGIRYTRHLLDKIEYGAPV
jgi:putative toxin-antitoxin system antitoxin component (TIGR02293 family)